MHCSSCGAEIVAGSVYCHKCGERVASASEPAKAGAAPPDGPSAGAAGLAGSLGSRRDRRDDVEEELWAGRYSSKDMIGAWALAALLTIASVAAGVYLQNPVAWMVVAGAIVVIWAYPLVVLLYRRMSVRYRLTTQRFFHEQGILRHVTDRIEVIDMDDVSFEQSILQRMVNVGRIRIASSDRSHPALVLNGIDDVRRVASKMDDARRAERMRRGLHIEAV